jgi:transcriptional regulator with XRE-family HTH domain
MDLKLRRVAARLQVKDVAQAMGISSSRISRIEDPDHSVTPRMERRYMAAILSCTSGTSSHVASSGKDAA